MKHISSIKPTVEKGLYGLVKRPDAKTPDLSELNKTIKKFQDTPDTHFTSALKKRVPSNSSYKLESKDDFGLSKRFKSGSLTKLETPDAAAKLVDSRFSDKSKPFKISEGITGLNKQFQKVLPKKDYSYTDPQYYEYKLKGQTMKDQQLNAFKNQNEDDIDKLDIQGKYKKWREEDLGKKATKIQKLFRGSSVREDLGEGMNGLDKVPPNEMKNADVRDVIEVGKARRKEKGNAARNEKITLREKIQQETEQLEDLYNLERQFRAETLKLNERKKEHDKKVKRNQFLEDSGIEEYALKGQETKQRKREEKKEKEERTNKGITGLQKAFRGTQSRKKNFVFSDDNTKRFMVENPKYDPTVTNPFDERSSKYAYDQKKASTLTDTERKAINYDRTTSRVKQKLAEQQGKRQGRRLVEVQQNLQDQLANFVDKDERPLQERLSAAYSKKEKPVEPNKRKLNPVSEAWAKKQEEIDEKSNEEKEQLKQHQQHSTEIANYESLMKLLESSNGGSKTTAAMNNLIPYVYQSFGKNAGTNTNRKVSTVIKQLQQWHDEKEAKTEKAAQLASQFSTKKREAEERKKQAKKDDAKMRNAPSSKANIHTLESINEEKGGGGRVYNMDKRNRNKSNLIPQEYELMKAPKTAEGKSRK